MKRILTVSILLLCSALMFAGEVFKGAENLIENFLNKGTYIKVYKADDDIYYVPKTNILQLACDDDEFTISTLGSSAMTGKGDSSTDFKISKYDFKLDDNNNLIITKK